MDSPDPIPSITQRITGLVLAGGEGRRMGGLDKGLQALAGKALARHAAERLAPQVGTLAINANRHLDDYRAWGWPVWADALPDGVPPRPGPLAGWLTGLQQVRTPWLLTVPCDTPAFPLDLAARLAAALLAEDAELAVAATPDTATSDTATSDPGAPTLRPQPVFCLLRRELALPLADALRDGERRVMRWAGSRRVAIVRFDDVTAFDNLNTLADLHAPR
ncbi:molybdenum cofactor guanylyltransferase MobA [Sphaerotilus mobilis]|uniref:Molybdenum cofactor guanylyltransferase n=1 Tax=Sphaerotilus mobilis TaxID=47994 RepID=A0A4Q7LJY8_9BURK|nr:molybdenum cofactor guanylyltransferase MobA [Sphaerotilus mobilis]RZS54411.1 molybdenum cofactor guanylyltransferase [Sphaerotilus mobilis]